MNLPAADAAKPPALSFYLPFDGTAKAETAGGAAEPRQEKNLAYGSGISGQALLAGPELLLEYAGAGNLDQRQGTVMLWFKANWNSGDFANDSDKRNWHCLFGQLRPQPRLGSGALWFFLWGNLLRGDMSDEKDSYTCLGANIRKGEWHHLAFSWGPQGPRVFLDGVPGSAHQKDSGSPLSEARFDASAVFESFFVGCHNGLEQADGYIDEFKIFDAPLSPEQVQAEVAKVRPLRLRSGSEFLRANERATATFTLTNLSASPLAGTLGWKLVGPDGATVAEQADLALAIEANSTATFSCDIPGLKAGEYELRAIPAFKGMEPLIHRLWVLRQDPMIAPAGTLDLKLIETVDFTQELPAERFVSTGENRKGTCDGKPYLEAGPKQNDRFAVKVTLPRPFTPYLLEWDYPDDGKRTMEVIVQEALNSGNSYELQTGVFCGDEYPTSGTMLVHRCVYWAKEQDIAVIFMTARKDAPAAVAQLRIYEIAGGLPDAGVKPAAAVDGWTRTLAVYFEDPAVIYNFGVKSGLMPDFEDMLDRLMAYMKWSGQDMFVYPGVWYQGAMYPSADAPYPYMPRPHPHNYIRCILEKFAAEGLTFMPTINLHNIPLRGKHDLGPAAIASGTIHATPAMILDTGKPNPGGWHGTPPNFNPLHPATQEAIARYVEDMLDLYADSPAFKGIVFHLTTHTTLWFGGIEAGYNDYCIEQFERDTGITVPVPRDVPERGKLYYEWLTANAREPWIDWRCQQISVFYRRLADQISARRPDLRLGIFSYRPTVSELKDPRFGTPGYPETATRESGFDPKYYQDSANIIVAQTIYPADYRWSFGRYQKDNIRREMQRDRKALADTYAVLESACHPWVNMHDRYWEDPVGKDNPLKAEWLREHPWRVSTLNPNHIHFMEQFILPLRHGDVLGFSKGGFLIGTLGFEEQMAEFSKAFRALPAKRFGDLPGSPETVKCRSLTTPEETWFYAVNTSPAAATVSFVLDRQPAQVVELSDQRQIAVPETRFRVELKPYQLRSFKLGAGATVLSAE
jgi:hypothetical protein